MLIENPKGNYSFLKGIAPYSGGAVASRGFEVEHARLQPALPLHVGFAAVDKHLKAVGRPRQALCAMELRSPRPFTFQGFADFNAGYVDILKSWDILQNGLTPVARTNVAPEVDPPIPLGPQHARGLVVDPEGLAGHHRREQFGPVQPPPGAASEGRARRSPPRGGG